MPFEVSGAAWLPGALAGQFGGELVTALRLEGFSDSVADRVGSLQRAVDVSLAEPEFDTLWPMVRDVAVLAEPRDTAIWRVSVPPSAGAQVLEAMTQARGFLDWGGGLVWLSLPDEDDCGAKQLRAIVAQIGGHAMLVRASEAKRASLEVFQPQPRALAALTARVKDSFDPLRILNPGRMYADV